METFFPLLVASLVTGFIVTAFVWVIFWAFGIFEPPVFLRELISALEPSKVWRVNPNGVLEEAVGYQTIVLLAALRLAYTILPGAARKLFVPILGRLSTEWARLHGMALYKPLAGVYRTSPQLDKEEVCYELNLPSSRRNYERILEVDTQLLGEVLFCTTGAGRPTAIQQPARGTNYQTGSPGSIQWMH